MLTFIGGVLGVVASWLLTVVIPPMPLYSEFYKTANHQGDIFLQASLDVMAGLIRHALAGGNHQRLLAGTQSVAPAAHRSPALRIIIFSPFQRRSSCSC